MGAGAASQKLVGDDDELTVCWPGLPQ